MADAILRVAPGQKIRLRDEHGQPIVYHAGDHFSIRNKQKARELVAGGRAIMPGTEEAKTAVIGDLSDAGIVVRNGGESVAGHIIAQYEALRVQVSEFPALPFNRTLILDAVFPMLPQRCVLGLARVEQLEKQAIAWEAAAMLQGHDVLVSSEGSAEDREGTKELIGDLRLPVYQPAAVWLRKTRATDAFVQAWADELKKGTGEIHAMTRALYTNRIILCTLPQGWLAKWLGE